MLPRVHQNQPRTPNGPRAASPGGVSHLLEVSAEQRAGIGILVIDDERSLRESCATVLEHEGYRVTLCRCGEEALELLKRQRFDIVLVDLYLTPVTGLDLLRTARKTHRGTIVIVITGNPSVASSMEALRLGAWDYLPKPFSAIQFQILIGRAAQAVLVAREAPPPRGVIARRGPDPDNLSVLGNSPQFRKVMELARKVAPSNASVFITGESGTGKELVAQFIHQHSRRSTRPLVAINCAALPETLLESEMFGHVKGAFTGAVRDKLGLLEAANGGTLFLDELLEMPKPIQAKLLRVLQDGVVRRVGSETTDAIVDVRFIAATNGSPEQAVESGALREDLYYRLQVVPIHLPPLRERRDDIPLLAKSFLTHYWTLHRRGEPEPRLSPAALHKLREHPWKGNVRELENVFEHAVVLLEAGAELQPSDLPFPRASGFQMQRLAEPPADQAASSRSELTVGGSDPVSSPADCDPRWQEEPYHTARDRVTADFERRYLLWLMNHTGGNLTKAARMAGVERTSLYRMMERHGLQRVTMTVSLE